jgi:hypothetical protein
MFYLRLNKVRILNNRELLGKAEMQLMSFVTLGDSDFPMLNDFFRTNDDNQKKELVKQAVTKVISSRIMPEIQKIKDNQIIYFGDCGYNVFVSENIPKDLNWMLLAVESDSRIRDNAALVKSILTEKNITTIVGAIGSLASLSNPLTSVITTLLSLVSDALIEIFKHDKDDQAGLLLTSFIQQQHYPNGKRDKEDVPDTTGNMFIDYTIFAY